ncbi:MAG TPA: chemotaxis response regulator protein-glutamate methylesterase [Kofleriaceae bacterium]|nr:chemotaxis response regulator protein-glutamate methylesterase [Kofleriaceae bacterium]
MTVRILVIDDSVVIRKILTATLNEVPGLEVVATAALGKIGLAKIPQCNPDIVILDVEMPEMDGIETLRRIRKDTPHLPVVMFSTKTERGAAATIEALTCGASDYVAKPSNAGNVLAAMARVREELVPKIVALTSGRGRPPARITRSPAPLPLHPTTPSASVTLPLSRLTSQAITRPIASLPTTPITDGPIRLYSAPGPRPPVSIVAIGASTGGPNALSVLLAQLPADFQVPIVIVQHMLATFTRHFADRLASQCRIKIVEASPGEAVAPGTAYIARGDHHLLIERRQGRAVLALNQDQVENFCRPAVDVLFRSVAASYGPNALGVVLTGMGHDGLLGCGAIRDAGGDVIVQDEASSVVWGMPGFVARAGIASQVMPLDQLGGEVRRRVALGAIRAVGAVP